MRLVERLRYRWQHECDPYGVQLAMDDRAVALRKMAGSSDAESRPALRKWRALLFGKGWGWTFAGALKEAAVTVGGWVAIAVLVFIGLTRRVWIGMLFDRLFDR